MSTFASIHLPSSDLAASRRFYVDILCAEPVADDAESFRVSFGDFEVVVAVQDGGGTPRGAEYPHYAFDVTPEQYAALKRRLDGFGVPTNEPWTRKDRPHALLYFRDPSENQFELFSPNGGGGVPLRVGLRSGGDYETDFDALSYHALPPPPDPSVPKVRAKGFSHMTVPVRDLAEGKRFYLEAVGGTFAFESRTHVQVVIGGVELGIAAQDRGYTAPGTRLPRRRYNVDSRELRDMQTRFNSFGVALSGPATNDGSDTYLDFRDPSGNLFELYCANPDDALRAAVR